MTLKFLSVLLCLSLSSVCLADNSDRFQNENQNYFTYNHVQLEKRDYGFTSGFILTARHFPSRSEGISRRVHIYIPRDYDASKHYPVLYLNDGQNIFDAGPFGSWNVSKELSELLKENPYRKQFIIVATEATAGRAFEYTHVVPWKDYEVSNERQLHVSKYANFLTQELKPFIDYHFHTLSDKQNTFIGGSSLGGLAAFYIGVTKRAVFGTVLAMSPSFWVGTWGKGLVWGESSILNWKEVREGLQDTQERPRIWIDWGAHEGDRIKDSASEMVHLLQVDYGFKMNQDLHAFFDHMGHHNEATWGGRFRYILNHSLMR